ncbi:MAG: DUF4145 domain-containing protein [Cellulomonas sp.]|uniref:DUF4145 domain-containing protein n=1 Tax=Cellulomonas sp. TaxID=40001 RepID=UPI001849A7DA|nr:DUF4145 domain-containing protein [Cellulomonas sp.]NMM29685.1 DUF4145 domain-containing protein [Cellulomonas sp.]
MADSRSAPLKHLVVCFYCERAVTATEAGTVEDGNPENGPPSLVTLARCDRCGQALLLVQEDYGMDEGWDDPVRVWPGAVRPLSSAVPERLRAEHSEARSCFEGKAYTATVVMVRRTLEGVCADQGVNERTLAASLAQMKEKDLLDQRLLDWAQALRVVGNEGAHYTGERVSREDARDALSFAEALLDYLYVLAGKFEEFSARRATRKAPPPTTGGSKGDLS